MYDYNGIMADIEELVFDFLVYRKTKRESYACSANNSFKSVAKCANLNNVNEFGVDESGLLITDMFEDAMLPMPIISMEELENMDNMGENENIEEMPNNPAGNYEYENGGYFEDDNMGYNENYENNNSYGNGNSNNMNNNANNNNMGNNMNNNANNNMGNNMNNNANNNMNNNNMNNNTNNNNMGNNMNNNANNNMGNNMNEGINGNYGNNNTNNNTNGNTPNNSNEKNEQLEYIKMIYAEINKKMYPIIEEVLREYNFKDSPIFDSYIDKETLAQIVDKVIERAKISIEDVNKLEDKDEDHEKWGLYQMLRAIVESLVIFQLYILRNAKM